jgi:type II secretion system protein N
MMKAVVTKIRSIPSTLFRAGKGRRWGTVLLALVVLLLFFALGFRLFFPVDALRQRLEGEMSRRSGAQIEMQRLSLGLPLSLELQKIRIENRRPPLPAFDVDSVELTPGWLSLVSGDPGVEVRAELYDGELLLSLARSGHFALDLDALRLDRLPAVPLLETPVRLSGALSGQAQASEPPLRNRADTTIELRIDNAAVTGLEPLGVASGKLALGNVQAKGKLQGRRLNIETLKAVGGDLGLDGEGNLLIGSDSARTRLNLQITLRPGTGLDPMLRDLLSLSGAKPASDGSYRFRLGGSLARPVMR